MLDDATDLYSKGSEIPWSGMSDQTMLHRFIAEQQQFAPMNSDVCTKRGSGVPCLPHIDYCQRLFLVALNPGGDVQLVPTAPPADPTKSQMLSTTTGSSPAIFHAPGPVCKNAQQNMSCPLAFLQEWQPEPIIDCLHATRKQRTR
uniref:Uncharacterized protein n=1 Tax=Octactis speculum TaxID=3111310 RepID=A0A7S2D0M6_9STRA|mmetsp:Transcript_42101/g.57457  ORF Transcript_42101/g.57457 Transcript_42101/m.57457 type:complete len:145 (+) Transcript_42101:3-437(+)